MAREVKLLRKCLKGDPKAFEVIVAKYQELVCAITFSGTADVQQSEELAHQTFINAWKNLSQLKDLSRFRPWLCTIARNNIRNFINKNQRDIIAKAKPMEDIKDIATNDSGPLESAIKKEHEALVSDAIEKIPEQYREPLVLYYRQKESVKQVALSLDLSEDVVKQRLQRGRKMIKEQLSSIVEETLSATGPKKAFTAAVIASVAGMAIKGSGVAAAAGIATASSTTGTATGVAAIMSGVTAKIITAAAVVVIGVGAVFTYKQITKPSSKPDFSQAGMTVQKEVTELPSDETANFFTLPVTKNNLDIKESSSLTTEVTQKTDKNKSNTVEANSVPAQSDNNFIVGGFVQSEDGEPIPDADVCLLWDIKRDMPMLATRNTVTDVNGRWECQVTDEAEDISIRLEHSDYLSLFFQYRPSFDDLVAQSAVLIMRKGLQVSGFVCDIEGYPVPDALIMPSASITGISAAYGIQDSAKTTRTDANGYFLLRAVELKLQDIAVDANGYAPTFVDVNIIPEMSPIEITLDYGKNLTGVVVDVNGEPLPGVRITVDRWQIIQGKDTEDFSHKTFSILRRRVITDAAGQYSIDHLPSIGDVDMMFTKKPHFLSSSIQNNMAQNETKAVTMYPIPTITGTVIDDDTERPITEFEVVGGCEWEPNGIGRWDLIADKITSPQGNFSKTKSNFATNISPGLVAVKINAKGYLPAQTPWMRIDQELSPITIRLKKAQIFSSTLFYSDGVAVSNTDVILIPPSSRVYVGNGKLDEGIVGSKHSVIKTDNNGYFEFSAVSLPTTILVLDYYEYLVADTNNLKDKLTLIPWSYVTGLVDTDSNVNSNVTVQIASVPDPNAQIQWMSEQTTNADGRFDFYYIPATPQKTYYGPADSTNTLNKGPDINPRPDQELELRLGPIQSVDPNITSTEKSWSSWRNG
ncbi:MAG TPA: sigma-70 family RNA polymerase sigma factor [Sedimentisphaerales bacterium]|nr:sigma-70 family RNA polymerase sigma factor [Sedimentisphaerales bacterium]